MCSQDKNRKVGSRFEGEENEGARRPTSSVPRLNQAMDRNDQS